MFQDLDLTVDLLELRELGLTEEEIQGYFDFFANAYKLRSTDERPN